MAKKVNPFDKLIEQSLAEIEANSNAIEQALSSFASQDDINITESEYNELERLTNTLNEVDRILVSIETAPTKKKSTKKPAKKKKVAKKKTK